jgi:toxin ParE1/3/4
MARFRLSLPARADLAQILATSVERWGTEGKRRYAKVLAAGMRKVAADPDGPTTRDRAALRRGIRSFHLRNARVGDVEAKVRKPVHVLFYRVAGPGVVEIVRILHERMEPSRHIGADLKSNAPSSKRPTQ